MSQWFDAIASPCGIGRGRRRGEGGSEDFSLDDGVSEAIPSPSICARACVCIRWWDVQRFKAFAKRLSVCQSSALIQRTLLLDRRE